MKVGDPVYLVTDPLAIGGGIAATIKALDKSTAQITVESPQVLSVNSWDLLPANIYTQAILQAVYETFESVERKDGSILNLQTRELIERFVERGINRQTAGQCAHLFDVMEWKASKSPLFNWVKRIRDCYCDDTKEPVALLGLAELHAPSL